MKIESLNTYRWSYMSKGNGRMKAYQRNKAFIIQLKPSGARTTEDRKVQRGQLVILNPACYFEGLGFYPES